MFDKNKEDVLQFFKFFIEDFIVEDLKILIPIAPNPVTKLGGCTIPTAMTIISSIELIGFLLKDKGKTGESNENIYSFLTYDNNRFFPSYYDGKSIKKIVNYRQGMMHHFFPKFKNQLAGICKDTYNNNLFICYDLNKPDEESLNISVFAKDFLTALEKLKAFLQNSIDEVLFNTILSGLGKLEDSLGNVHLTTTCTTMPPGVPHNKRNPKN